MDGCVKTILVCNNYYIIIRNLVILVTFYLFTDDWIQYDDDKVKIVSQEEIQKLEGGGNKQFECF